MAAARTSSSSPSIERNTEKPLNAIIPFMPIPMPPPDQPNQGNLDYYEPFLNFNYDIPANQNEILRDLPMLPWPFQMHINHPNIQDFGQGPPLMVQEPHQIIREPNVLAQGQHGAFQNPGGFHFEPHEIVNQVQFEEEQYEEEEEEEEEEDEEDPNLMQNMRVPPPVPTPYQLDTFQHCMKVGFFVASIEMLNDRAGSKVDDLREFALAKVEELIDMSGEIRVPEIEGLPLCGTPRIKRDLKRMSRHIPYYEHLLEKFIEEFDGSAIRVSRLRRATGFIKGLLTMERVTVFNITDASPPGNFDNDLQIFKVNAEIFVKFLASYTNDFAFIR